MMKPVVLVAVENEAIARKLLKCANVNNTEVIWVLPDDPRATEASVAACWYPSPNLLLDFPNLRCLHSLGAGTDNLGSLLDGDVSICRIVDEEQKRGMLEYVLWGILTYQRDMDVYQRQQKQHLWMGRKQRQAKDTKIAILGMGEIGSYVASRLSDMGYDVRGWSRTEKSISGVTHYAGSNSLPDLLGDADVLVNLLPLNDQTQGLLNKDFLSQLPESAALIHCGRGGHLIENDLVTLLEEGRLRGALLDVFETEPLPENSVLWDVDNVIITPHAASTASFRTMASQISDKAISFLAY